MINSLKLKFILELNSCICNINLFYKKKIDPHMMHNTKFVGRSHNIDGIQKMMSNTGFVRNGQIVQSYLNTS